VKKRAIAANAELRLACVRQVRARRRKPRLYRSAALFDRPLTFAGLAALPPTRKSALRLRKTLFSALAFPDLGGLLIRQKTKSVVFVFWSLFIKRETDKLSNKKRDGEKARDSGKIGFPP
jgi:hypothetical protein